MILSAGVPLVTEKRKFIRDAIAFIVGGIVLEPTLKALDFDALIPDLPQVWFVILSILVMDALSRSERFRTWAPNFYRRLSYKNRMISFLVVGLIGFIAAALLWSVTTGVFKLRQRSAKGAADATAEATAEVKPRVEVTAYLAPNDAPYPKGTILGGIQWDEKYSDVRINITNGSTPILNLDLSIVLDTHIAAAGQLSVLPNVTILPPRMPAVWLGGTDQKGNPANQPVDSIKSGLASGPEYRVHCAQLFSDASLQLIVAAIAVNPPSPKGELPQQLFAPKRPPQVIHIKGTYETSGVDGTKRYTVDFSHRFGAAAYHEPATPEPANISFELTRIGYERYNDEVQYMLPRFKYKTGVGHSPIVEIKASLNIFEGGSLRVPEFSGVWHRSKVRSKRFSTGDSADLVLGLVRNEGIVGYEYNLLKTVNGKELSPKLTEIDGKEFYVQVVFIARMDDDIVLFEKDEWFRVAPGHEPIVSRVA